MIEYLDYFANHFMLFVLVLTRISGLVMTAPIYGSRSIPLKIRAFIAVGLAMMITPLQEAQLVTAPANLIDAVLMMSRELLLGLAMGLGVTILFAGLHLAGQLVAQVSGLALADVFDPTFESQVPVFTQLLDATTLSVFLIMGGHRHVLLALLDTFRWRAPGAYDLPNSVVQSLSAVVSESFVVGIRAGAPVIVALILAVIILGLVSRTLPQLNILAVGFSLNAVVMLLTLSLTVGSIAWLLNDRSEAIVEEVHAAIIAP